jgi:hypothetical protein
MIDLRQFVERTTGEDDAEGASKWWVGGEMKASLRNAGSLRAEPFDSAGMEAGVRDGSNQQLVGFSSVLPVGATKAEQ